MNGPTTIIDSLAVLAQGSGAIDRWQGMRNSGGVGGHPDLIRWVLIGLGALALAGLIASWLHTRRQERRKWDRFKTLGEHAGLRGRELVLLRRLVQVAGLKEPSTIYTNEDVFNTAALKIMKTPQVIALPDMTRRDLQGSLVSMHIKLRFGLVEEGDELDVFRSSRQIEIGSKVFITKMGQQMSIEAEVTGNSRVEFVLTADEEIPARRDGDTLTIRYAQGHGAWEFDTTVVRCDGKSVAVDHSQELRAVNFRRFPRIATKMHAMVAIIPFHLGASVKPLEFITVEIVEIAGPGLLVKMPVLTEIGRSILIRLQLDAERFIQGMTKVRRVLSDRPGGPYTAVEFVELDADELTELTRATNLAAKHKLSPGAVEKTEMALV